MFTGIVERTAVVASAEETGGGLALGVKVSAEAPLPQWMPVELGESISVSGACLTAVEFDNAPDGGSVSFEVVPESLEKTTLGGLRAGDIVNIERALRAGETFGGHYVTGHVDGIGEIVKIERQGDQSLFRVSTAPGLIEQMLDKGSVSVDGASLTIVEVARKEGWFSFAAIPHTMERTILGRASEGGEVNIETDACGKWALHGLQCLRGDGVPDERGGPLIGMFEEGGSMKSPRDDSASGPVGE